jgi:hypothetical protein
MTEHDYWKVFPRMPKKVTIGDFTVRDGFQHEEKFISSAAKIYYLEELIFAGCRNIEVTNLGNPQLMPQFRDAEELLTHLRSDSFRRRCAGRGIVYDDICLTAITIRESAVDRVLVLGKQLEKTVGKRLRSEAVINGRTRKEDHPEYTRTGLAQAKQKFGEMPDQNFPSHWTPQAVLPEKYRA